MKIPLLLSALVLAMGSAYTSAVTFADLIESKLQDNPLAQDFLPADEAFQFSHEQTDTGVQLHWQIAPGYYLYQERFQILIGDQSVGINQADFSRTGEPKEDPNFGLVHIYHQDIHLNVHTDLVAPKNRTFTVRYQGCAEAGLCYPPIKQTVTLIP